MMLALVENIYITIGNVSVSGRGSCTEGIPDTLCLYSTCIMYCTSTCIVLYNTCIVLYYMYIHVLCMYIEKNVNLIARNYRNSISNVSSRPLLFY